MEKTIEGPNGKLQLSMTDGGDAEPIVFLHSDGGTLHHWDEVRVALDPRHPTLALDRRGHGRSEVLSNGSFAPADAASDVLAAADAAGFHRFVLVGHSGGALVAFASAALHPERVSGLVLVDPPPDPAVLPPGLIEDTLQALRSDQYEVTIEQYYRSIAGEKPEVAERVIADVRATPKTTIIGSFAAMAGFRPQDYVGRYRGPALSIIQPQYDVDGALHRIAGIGHSVIGGAGHWIHLGAPERFLKVLTGFLARLH
jgi:pimeloyl-ACP methyl ester carboxylesterase